MFEIAEIKVGMVAAPEFPTKLANRLQEELPERFEEELNEEATWKIENITDGLITVAEDEKQLLDDVVAIKDREDWDYTICLTDIPIFYEKEVILARVHETEKVAVISLPALGWFVNKRASDVVHQIMDDLYDKPSEQTEEKVSEEYVLRRIKKQRVHEEGEPVIRYRFSLKLTGLFTILMGMAYDNQPWKIMYSLKSVIAVAFGSGAYGLIFPTLWMISYNYSPMRLAVYMILAIIGLGLWIIQGHNLWETDTLSDDSKYRRLYNAATVVTLLFAVSVFYLILFLLFLMTTFIFVEPGFYVEQVGTSNPPTLINYIQLAWLTTSVGTVTGAVGVGLEEEESVRQATYGHRQRQRYEQMQEQKEEEEEGEEKTTDSD